MSEFETMGKKILKISFILAIIASLIALIIFRSWKVFIGVLIGCGIALVGFGMISKFSFGITGDVDAATKQGRSNYMIRYGFYTVTFLGCALIGIPVLSLFAGFMCHKGAIVLYALMEGRDSNE
ncbi:MAG: hypothetical protein HUJ53_09035 [Holdemanella sp.]|nr:hypothetical protein [Holdemanella sp.]